MLLSYVMINLDNHKYFYDPYPHAFFENVFDKKFYKNLCKEFPSEQKFESFDFDKQNKLKQKKFVLNDGNPLFKKIINEKINFKNLYTYLSHENFRNKILGLLEKNFISLPKNNNQSFFKKLYYKFKSNKKFGFEFSMISSDGGFIKPHTDGPNKLVSFVMPIIDNDNFLEIKNSGTSILKPLMDKYKYNYSNQTVPFEATEEVRQIPFNKNQIFLFIKTHNSLHSVGPMINPSNKAIMRKSINFFLYK